MHRLQLSTAGECVSSSLRPAFHEYIFSAFPTCAPPPVESIIGVGFRVPLCFVLMLRESVASRTERAPAGRMAESMDEKGVRALFSKLGLAGTRANGIFAWRKNEDVATPTAHASPLSLTWILSSEAPPGRVAYARRSQAHAFGPAAAEHPAPAA